MNNEERAVDYLDSAFNRHDMAHVATYWSDKYIQHNPLLANGVPAIKSAIEDPRNQNMTWVAGMTFSSGDIVAVHGLYRNFLGEKDMVTVDFLRFANGKVVEHWDVMQEAVKPEHSANGNAMFPIDVKQ